MDRVGRGKLRQDVVEWREVDDYHRSAMRRSRARREQEPFVTAGWA
jgi:hypothetical protein